MEYIKKDRAWRGNGQSEERTSRYWDYMPKPMKILAAIAATLAFGALARELFIASMFAVRSLMWGITGSPL